jgi:hypothetical protein
MRGEMRRAATRVSAGAAPSHTPKRTRAAVVDDVITEDAAEPKVRQLGVWVFFHALLSIDLVWGCWKNPFNATTASCQGQERAQALAGVTKGETRRAKPSRTEKGAPHLADKPEAAPRLALQQHIVKLHVAVLFLIAIDEGRADC